MHLSDIRQFRILFSSFLAATITVAVGNSSSLIFGNVFFEPIDKSDCLNKIS